MNSGISETLLSPYSTRYSLYRSTERQRGMVNAIHHYFRGAQDTEIVGGQLDTVHRETVPHKTPLSSFASPEEYMVS